MYLKTSNNLKIGIKIITKSLTFRSGGNEVNGPCLGPQVLAGSVDPDVHALGLLRRSDVQLHEPVT